jgi:hypothetical protein
VKFGMEIDSSINLPAKSVCNTVYQLKITNMENFWHYIT